jgi:hypothetical protein
MDGREGDAGGEGGALPRADAQLHPAPGAEEREAPPDSAPASGRASAETFSLEDAKERAGEELRRRGQEAVVDAPSSTR